MARVHTKLGSLTEVLERVTSGSLIIAYLVIIIGSGVLYFLLTPYGHGITANGAHGAISVFDGIYFSTITITTVGYGDFAPNGLGRVLAMLEILSGLFLFALVIAKMASARQAQLLALIFASQQRERLIWYYKAIETLTTKLRSAACSVTGATEVRECLAECNDLCSGLSRYIHMLAKTKTIDSEYQNWKLLRLLKSMSGLAGVGGGISLIVRNNAECTETARTLLNYMKHTSTLIAEDRESESQIRISATRLQSLVVRQLSELTLTELSPYSLQWGQTNKEIVSNPAFVEAVASVMKTAPPTDTLHVLIAEQLKVSRNAAFTVMMRLQRKEASSSVKSSTPNQAL